jgi:ubiquinone biosynthesis monooxygenase Coq7
MSVTNQKPLTEEIKSMIRVNQAGEYGAARIYAGQLAVLKGTPAESTLTEMAEQEAAHLKKFNRLSIEHEVRPTLLQPLWHVGGYALGMVTAFLGEKAAHACTIAVEEVIDEHYQEQLEALEHIPDQPTSLVEIIEECRQDELAHKETAIEMGGHQAPAYELLSTTIKTISRTAIWLSKRI